MIPAQLKRSITTSAVQSIHSLDGKLIGEEYITANIHFIGVEDVSVEAGRFACLHFSITHNYKDSSQRSIQKHTYEFWIAQGIGIVKFIHTFVPFIYIRHIGPEEKNIMNRYGDSFEEIFELKEARIKGKIIGGNH